MRVLVSINYARGLSEPLLNSLINSQLVEETYVVSDVDMSPTGGAHLYQTPNWVRSPFNKVTFRGIFRLIIHFWLMLYLTIRKNPDVIIGFHIFPHCMYAFICAKLFRKPVVACIGDWPSIWRIRRTLLPMLRRCNIVTTTGSKTKEYLVEQGINPNNIHARPDPTDTDKHKPIPSPKQFDILFVGRLATEKNVSTLLRIVDRVRRKKDDLKVGIVGDGSLRKSLEQLSKQLNLVYNVKFLGWKENSEYYYNCSKILILTSLHEGLPRVMIEAMACGIPCVVPDVGDITDAAIDRYNSIVIRYPTDVDGFTNALVELLYNDGLYQALSKNTRQSIEERYSVRSATQAWDKILCILDPSQNISNQNNGDAD